MQDTMLNAAGPALYSAVRGLNVAQRKYDTAAHNVANTSTDDFKPLREDGSQGPENSMDLASELVDANLLAPAAYAANAVVARTAAETQGYLLDIKA